MTKLRAVSGAPRCPADCPGGSWVFLKSRLRLYSVRGLGMVSSLDNGGATQRRYQALARLPPLLLPPLLPLALPPRLRLSSSVRSTTSAVWRSSSASSDRKSTRLNSSHVRISY